MKPDKTKRYYVYEVKDFKGKLVKVVTWKRADVNIKGEDVTLILTVKEKNNNRVDLFLEEDEVSVLNFKEFLEENGVDTKLFWKNCKRKHRKWRYGGSRTCKRTEIETEYLPSVWLLQSFNWGDSLQKHVEWGHLSVKWDTLLSEGNQDIIVFGFGNSNE